MDKIVINTKKFRVGDSVTINGIEITIENNETSKQFAKRINELTGEELTLKK